MQLKSLASTVFRYVCLAAAAAVVLAMVLMCSDSETATLIMAGLVFLLGLKLGSVWTTGSQKVQKQVTPEKEAIKPEPDTKVAKAEQLTPRLVRASPSTPGSNFTASHSPSAPTTPPQEECGSVSHSDSTIISSVASAHCAAQVVQPLPSLASCNSNGRTTNGYSRGSVQDSATFSGISSASNLRDVELYLNNSHEMPANLLSHLFPDRVKLVQFPENVKAVPANVTVEDSNLQLIGVKKGQKSGFSCYYWIVSAPNTVTLSPLSALDDLGDFARLSSHELLQSPADTIMVPKSVQNPQFSGPGKQAAIFDLEPNMFSLLERDFNDGCGYICSLLLTNLFGNTAKAQRLVAIQVRAVLPGLGIFKGILVRSPIPSDQPPIQLSPSMQKVGPSANPARMTRGKAAQAALLVNNQFPSARQRDVGRAVHPDRHGPPPRSCRPKSLLKPGQAVWQAMVTRLWRAQGASWDACERYAKQAGKSWNHSAHSWLVGVTDPTHSIPHDKVFVTGFPRKLPHVFCARSPCIQPNRGRILQLLTSKPAGMSSQHWEFLQGLEFGALVFPDAPQGQTFLPSIISNGDVDGDLYFCCWDADMLQELSNFQPANADRTAKPSTEADKPPPHGRDGRSWLEHAQDIMCDTRSMIDLQMLIGISYTLSEGFADTSDQFMDDRKAAAFAHAYEEALQYEETGCLVTLPSPLHLELPEKLRKYVST